MGSNREQSNIAIVPKLVKFKIQEKVFRIFVAPIIFFSSMLSLTEGFTAFVHFNASTFC